MKTMKLKMKMMTHNEFLSLLKERIEKRVRELLSENGDISPYLYFPPEHLSEFVKDQLDIFLIEKAFEKISEKDFDISNFIVYQDDVMAITLEEKNQKIEALEKLINYFISIEDYEKCSKVKYFLDLLK